ncbi:small integral membrane protein 24-like [Opisthocomus hoazin]|uniref:small integral membrane protein 24-like n=1 Tax=Opisthocomus hoazin TaxID=30419 RepID=UPI003F531F06
MAAGACGEADVSGALFAAPGHALGTWWGPAGTGRRPPVGPGGRGRARTQPGSRVAQEPSAGCPAPASLRPDMPRVPQPLSLLVLLVLATTARGQAGTSPKVLQPWLVGLTAIVVFLFIVFVLLLANRLWQIRMGRKQGRLQETPGADSLEHAGHANPAAEWDSDRESDSEEQGKTTAL